MIKPVVNKILFLNWGLLPILFSCSAKAPVGVSPPPNIVYILADDLGYGDLSILCRLNIRESSMKLLAG